MKWPANVLAYQALSAGFQRDDAITAVAVALAGTEGDDAYRTPAATLGATALVGAWSIPDDGSPLLAGVDLTKLSQNADAAHRLWEAAGRSWQWSAVWRAGTWRGRLDDARRGVAAPQRGVAAGVRYPELETAGDGPDLARAAEQFRGHVLDAIRFAANPRF